MSSRHTVSRRSRSRSPSRRREHRARSRDTAHSDRSAPRHHNKNRRNSSHSSRESKSQDRKSSKKHKKSKKKRKKSSSSSSSSSSESEQELKLLQRLEAERQRIKEEKRKEKEKLKANETPEEKRARRLLEKQKKERKRRERMGWDNEYQCYTNQDNPFGDSALTNTFVWTKKLAKEGVKNVSREELEAQSRQKQLENKIELEKVKQRRLEREAWRAEREAEAAAAAAAREQAQLSSWDRSEDAFHLRQAQLRSQIRIRDGRAKPIDLLAWYVSSEAGVEAVEMHEPYTYLDGLAADDLDDLLEDIKVYEQLGGASQQSYWSDVRTVAREQARRARATPEPRRAVHGAVAGDVQQVFKGKTGAQLEQLQQQISAKISGRRDGVDVAYWESLLSQLQAHMARARLRERHQLNLRRKLELLKQEQGVEQHSESKPGPSKPESEKSENESIEQEEMEQREESEIAYGAYRGGSYSPKLLAEDELAGVEIRDAEEDAARLHYLRARLHSSSAPEPPQGPAGATGADGERLLMAAAGAAGEGEAQFSVEVALAAGGGDWRGKYRPRKPRYFNRVHTGFEWNKYNQTHYDMDNPPPKIVQGYKFNIFYPDLIDKNATPHFSLKPCPENAEFAVLRFQAGPPYEDIAFKIVNREWEYSYKRGFRCHFHNNVFQLWFHFKRYRYRR